MVASSSGPLKSGKTGFAAFPLDRFAELHGYRDVMEGRHDRLKGLNPRGSVDYIRQRLQHLRIGVGIVFVCIALAFPQSDCNRILAGGIEESDFVFEALLLAQQRKNLILECAPGDPRDNK